jgi:HK97 family phage portal protein
LFTLRNGFGRVVKALGFGSEKKAILHDPAAIEFVTIEQAALNIQVGPSNAMRVPAVACAVSIISEKCGDLPAKLYHRDTKETAGDHPAYKLIHDEANPWTSAARFRIDLTIDALLRGDGFAQVVRAPDGRPFELHRLKPGTVQARFEDDGTPFYLVGRRNAQERKEYDEILHIQPSDGVAPIKNGRDAIALALALDKFVSNLLANGGRPSGIILAKKGLEPEAKQKIADSWFSSHSGDNAGGTAILDEEMDYKQLAASLADSQFAENRLEQIRQIGRTFRIPPTMLFELTRGTWSNTEEMARQFYTVTLKPWLTAWTWAYARVLLTPEERERFYIEFVTDDLLTADFTKKATALGQYRSAGVLTANEVRAMLNKPSHPDGDSLSNPHITTLPETPADKPAWVSPKDSG